MLNSSKWIEMDIVDKINYLLKEQGLTKKEFAHKLQLLEPRLRSTGNVPKEQTIYGYLNGKREIKIELIPYIAEVLNISEQELFTSELEYASNYNMRYSREARELINLLPHVPHNMIIYTIEKFNEYKILYEKNTSKIF